MKITPSLLAAILACFPMALSADQPMAASYMLCAACHGPDGKGVNAGTPVPMAPSLHRSHLVQAGDGEILASIIMTGIAKEDQKYLGVMAPLGAAMNAEQMTELINYLRQNFENQAAPVTVEQVTEWKGKYSGQPPQKRSDIEAATAEASN